LREEDHDAMLARFGRARQWDLELTKHMLGEFLKWREESKPEKLTLTPAMNHFLKFKTFQILPKPDKFGRPILVFPF